MNFKELQEKIEQATKKAFREVFEKHKEEDIYAFALYSDEGAMTVCNAINTIDALNDLEEEEKKEWLYYKYEPAEWKYGGAEKDFDEICRMLFQELETDKYENDDDDVIFVSFRNVLYQTCIKVLEKLKIESFFRNIVGKDIFLTFSVSDSDFEFRQDILTKLNENHYKEEYTEYLLWLKINFSE